MNEHSQNEHPVEDQPGGTVSPPPDERPAESSPARQFKLTWEFVAGFLGWYLVTAMLFGAVGDQTALTICGGLLFPINVIILIILLRTLPQMGWGMLSALGINFVVSLILGLTGNAFCFIPFFHSYK